MPAEVLQLGRPGRRDRQRPRQRRRRPDRRRLALALTGLLVLAASVVSGWWLARDHTQTWSAADTQHALRTFRSATALRELRVVDGNGFDRFEPAPSRPCRAAPRLDLEPALDAVTWSDQVSYGGLPPEVLAVRYASPSAARRALGELRTAVRACAGAVVPDTEGVAYRIVEQGPRPTRWWGDRLEWSSQLADPDGTMSADPVTIGAEARQTGNVVAVATGTDLTDLAVRRSLTDDLTTALRGLPR